jgi:hypothetical protein
MRDRLMQRLRPEAVGVVGLVALVVVLALPSKGGGGGVRVALAAFGMFVVPGWLIVRRADEDGDWVIRLFAGALVSACAYVLFGFAAFEMGLRLTSVEYVVPAVIIGVFALVLGGPGSSSSVHLASVGVAALLSLTAVVGGLVTHLALPAAPVEAAYAIATSNVAVTPTSVQATVTVDRIGTGRPQVLLLYVDGKLLATSTVPAGARSVRLTARRPATAGGACPQRIAILTSSGVYLTPPFHCAGS